MKVHTSASVECNKSYQVDSDLLYYFGDEEFGTKFPSVEILNGIRSSGINLDLFNLMTKNSRHKRNADKLSELMIEMEQEFSITHKKMDRCKYNFFVGPDCRSLKVHFTRGDVDQMDCENQMLRFTGNTKTTRQ